MITGGNSGLGLEAAKILTPKGGRVVNTSRQERNADAAPAAVREVAKDEAVARKLWEATEALVGPFFRA